jgi:hypothetical protein
MCFYINEIYSFIHSLVIVHTFNRVVILHKKNEFILMVFLPKQMLLYLDSEAYFPDATVIVICPR